MAKPLVFWRYTVPGDSNNSQSFGSKHPKVRQAAKTASKNLIKRVEELGFDSTVWTYDELTNWGSDLDDDLWSQLRDDDIIQNCISKIKKGEWGKGYHSPPARRGLYAFPENFVEWFLIMWKENSENKLSKHIIPHGGDIWCHFQEEAITLGIPILKVKEEWVLVEAKDYLRLLKKAINTAVAEARKYQGKESNIVSAKNLNQFTGLEHFEVFIAAH